MTWAELRRRGGDRVREGESLASYTTYRVGGEARALVIVASRADLDEMGPALVDLEIPWFVVGNGSNLVVADGRLDVVAVHLTGEFEGLEVRGAEATLGAAMALPVAARQLSARGLTGFEWAVGVPGTVGGAVAMNAGGHGSDMGACVSAVEVWRAGTVEWWGRERWRPGYRTSAVVGGDIVLGARLILAEGDAEVSRERLREIVAWRREHQPGGANAGSVFRNPPGDSAGRLIEAAGCKGWRRGGAVVSEKHANFIQVEPGGTAGDLVDLIRAVREAVETASGVRLVTENRFVGFGDAP